jgi:arginyl-tRNA synthetase
MIVRKSDGGYGYSITDLAAIRHRIRDLHANRLVYVTDARQADHFAQVFAVARLAGWLPDDVPAEHVGYGMVLGPDGKPYKTREGKAMLLADLLDMAEEKAAPPIALAAIKYADLANGLNKDYVFDVDRMVSFNGNTGVYLQYAHTRICSILRKAGDANTEVDPTLPMHPAERALILAADTFGDALAEVGRVLEPHRLCGHLYELAKAFTDFYEACPVLPAAEPVRANRIALCTLSARTLREGLNLLGIAAPERM